MKPSLLILAAGIGSRFGGFKQMEPVGPHGEILLDYAIYDARKAGFGTIVFVITKKLEPDFRGYMAAHYGNNADFAYVYQELDAVPAPYSVPLERVKPWGTGHAVLVGKNVLAVPFAAINADDYYGQKTFAVLCNALETMMVDSNEMVMVGFDVVKTLSDHGSVSRGVCTVENGYLRSVVEHEKIRRIGSRIIHETIDGNEVELDAKAIVSMNCWGFAPKTIFPLLEKDFSTFLEKRGKELKSEFYLPSVVDDGIKAKKIAIKVLNSGEQWFGLTYAEDRLVVKDFIRKRIGEGVYPEKLFNT